MKKYYYNGEEEAMESLLLLQYQPTEYKDMNGHKGHNPADECLSYIMGEVKELATDAE